MNFHSMKNSNNHCCCFSVATGCFVAVSVLFPWVVLLMTLYCVVAELLLYYCWLYAVFSHWFGAILLLNLCYNVADLCLVFLLFCRLFCVQIGVVIVGVLAAVWGRLWPIQALQFGECLEAIMDCLIVIFYKCNCHFWLSSCCLYSSSVSMWAL